MRDKFDCFNVVSENLCGAEELMRRTRSLKIDCISLDGYYRTTKVSSFSHVAKPKYIFFVLLSAFCNRPRSKIPQDALGNRGIFRKAGDFSAKSGVFPQKSSTFLREVWRGWIRLGELRAISRG